MIYPHYHNTYEGELPGNDGRPGVRNRTKLADTLLFDLRRDPGERHNVISMYPERKEILEKFADEMRADLGDDLSGIAGVNRRSPGNRDDYEN